MTTFSASANGGTGGSWIFGGAGDDTIVAQFFLSANPSWIRLDGGAGNDIISGSGGLFGGWGNDILEGNGVLNGGNGRDVLRGAEIAVSFGPPARGNSTFFGGAGNDKIIVSGVKNTIYGESGADRFVFVYDRDEPGRGGFGAEIEDFDPTLEKIDMRHSSFDSLDKFAVRNYDTVSFYSIRTEEYFDMTIHHEAGDPITDDNFIF